MTEQQSISQQASGAMKSVAADEGTMKRALQMSMFASDKVKAQIALNFANGMPAQQASLTLGQIVGNVFAVEERKAQNKDGSPIEFLVAIGDFEAVHYGTGEVWSSPNAYLPKYYLEAMKAMLDKGTENVLLAVEIVLVPTGKQIPVAYEVRNLIARKARNPLSMLKAELAKTNRLRLPPPPAADEGDVLQLGYSGDAGLSETTKVVVDAEIVPDESEQAALTGNDGDAPGGKSKAKATA